MLFEIETLHELEEFAASELKQTLGTKMVHNRVEYRGRLAPLLSLRTAVAVHRYERFEGSRPTVILGDQRLREMLKFVTSADKFTGFRISSPGKDSAAMRRVRDSVAASTGLPEHPEGDLLVRIRRDRDGWEVLVRLTARSLSARPWRVADMPGALHATMAVMVDLTTSDAQSRRSTYSAEPRPDQRPTLPTAGQIGRPKRFRSRAPKITIRNRHRKPVIHHRAGTTVGHVLLRIFRRGCDPTV